MSSKPFRFKQFEVAHNKSTMKVGTDGVLLGAWAVIGNSKTILDIGTGTGLIALMTAQKNPEITIHGVEMDPVTFEQACSNITKSEWSDRIEIFNTRIQEFQGEDLYDTIISNPPFFKSGHRSNKALRDKARSSNHLPPTDLIASVKRLLHPVGNFSMIYPYEEGLEFIGLAMKNELHVSRKTIVRSRDNMAPERLLLQFKTEKTKVEQSLLSIYQSGTDRFNYTDDYISITKDFYLYM